MSSSAAHLVRTRLAPNLIDRARRLSVVPESGQASSRLAFVVVVTLLLVGGVVGLLLFNTSMQQAAFTENRLQEQATNLAARQEALTMQNQRMQDPQVIAEKAQRLGMVYPGVPAFLDVSTGRVEGKPTPADRSATPPLYARVFKPKAARTSHPATQTKTQTKTQTQTKTKTDADTPSGETSGRHASR